MKSKTQCGSTKSIRQYSMTSTKALNVSIVFTKNSLSSEIKSKSRSKTWATMSIKSNFCQGLKINRKNTKVFMIKLSKCSKPQRKTNKKLPARPKKGVRDMHSPTMTQSSWRNNLTKKYNKVRQRRNLKNRLKNTQWHRFHTSSRTSQSLCYQISTQILTHLQ